jgi:molecular chaperone DnaJ
MATETEYYTLLGVARTATDAEIKRAYRKLAQQWHPDVSKDPAADERFKQINEAYQVLSDPQRRQAYDMFGKAGANGQTAGPSPFGGGFGDIFDAFFGGAAGQSGRHGRPQAGSDLRYDLRISFQDAVKGSEPEIEFPVLDRCETCSGTGARPGTAAKTCPQCQGRGEVRQVRQTMLGQMVNVSACPRCQGEGSIVETPCETCRGDGRTEKKRRLKVSIPPGIDDGHQVRLSGEGEAGPRGGPKGSLYVAISVQAHPELSRDGTELYHELGISIAQAALGTRVTVPTIEGDEEIDVRPGTQPGAEIRLRGRGVPHLRRPGTRGDLHVMVRVDVPAKLSKRQRELLEAFAVESGETVGTGGHGGILDRVRDALG